MPTALRGVSTAPCSRAKAPSVCEAPGGRCKGAVYNGRAGYRSDDMAESAGYDLIVYRNTRAAERAFAAWESYARGAKRDASITYGYRTSARKNTRTIVIRQGAYIATLDLRDDAGRAAADKDLKALAEVYAARMRQAARDETPTASAAAVRV
ncbi:hypothetical protein [Streptomyces sp. NPDC087300]|uniref:hypothetical protein n=1 Tax=Streptomyces sp. NPDC087300 TaxID=3365780 RepID=UPI00382DFC03